MLQSDQVVPLQIEFDESTLNAWFDTVDRGIGQLPVDASLVVEGTKVSIVPETTGIGVDREAAKVQLIEAFSMLDPVTVKLPAGVILPDFTARNLEPVRAHVAQLLSTPIPVTQDNRHWVVDGVTVGPYLRVDLAMESAAPVPRLTVDTDGLARALRLKFREQVNQKRANALLGWKDGLVVLEPSTTGITMKAGAFAEAIAHSFLHGHERVEIPVVRLEPDISSHNLDVYGINTLLGQGDSNFEGGLWERDENIRVGTRALNGTLVPPGGTFSFNGAVGAITYEKGYQDAEVATAEMIGPDVGGGICQVSTTIFRAAIYAGLPIVEWYAHTRRLANYERDGWGPGFDASILQVGPNPEEWPDFKFANDTGNWLLIEATVSEPHVYINIYGGSDGRTVEVDSSAWSTGDNAFGFNRVVRDAQGTVIESRAFESYFQ